ncbi:unnamed protein product [Spirodela intermedia]|uniref:C3H1-type domain-containing protein n=1 Tax=Spirodela intermedia TaxID=51605 RepID=A0A7I8LHG8_SPIIN|nr:unnamed protein product [Spirodela intermedia]
MMIGEGHRALPAIHIPPWPAYEEAAGGVAYSLPVSGVISGAGDGGSCSSPYLFGEGAMAALQRFLPSNESYLSDDAGDESDISLAPPVDAYSCDEFRMYEFKVRRCARGRSHDWTECPYAHPGEKARRRDPRKYNYSGTACPDFRKGSCKRGDACEFAHGVFECWLHPTRYRTQPCKDGTGCRRRVCFFAHTAEQLRVLSQPQQQQQQSPRTAVGTDSYDGSPLRHQALDACSRSLLSFPTSTRHSPPISPPSDSPPLSPEGRSPVRISVPLSSSVNDILVSLRQLQLNKVMSSPSSWGLQTLGIGSPRGFNVSPAFSSLPATPNRASPATRGVLFDGWDGPTERVESGRDLRAKIYEKLSKENSLDRQEEIESGGPGGAVNVNPDVDWVSELVK